MMKNKLLFGVLFLCNLLLLFLQYYSVAVFFAIGMLLLPTLKLDLKKTRMVNTGLSVFLFFFLFLQSISFWLNPPMRTGYYITVSVTVGILYAGLLWAYLSSFAKDGIRRHPNHVSIHAALIALLLTALQGIYLIAFLPGNMNIDSYSQWGQAMGGIPLDNWHPVFSTMLLRVSYHLAGTPAVFTVFQVVMSIAVFIYLSQVLLKRSVRPFVVYALIFFIIAATVTLPSMVTLYKDNLYNVAFLFMTLFLFEIIDSSGAWLKGNVFHAVWFVLSMLFVMLSRNNGVYVVMASLAILILFAKGLRSFFLKTFGILLAVYFLFTGPIFDYLGAASGSPSEKYSILIQQIGSVVAHDGELNEAETEFLNTILPLDTWKETYHPTMADPVKFHEEYNKEFINDNQGELLSTWWSVFKKNPALSLKGHVQQIRPLWDINGWEHGLPGSLMFHFTMESPKAYYDPYVQEYTLDVPEWRRAIEDYSFHANAYDVETKPFITTLSALSLLWLILSSGLLWLKKKRQYLLVLVPVSLNIGTLLLAMPAYNIRYIMSHIYVGLFSLFLPLLTKRTESKGD